MGRAARAFRALLPDEPAAVELEYGLGCLWVIGTRVAERDRDNPHQLNWLPTALITAGIDQAQLQVRILADEQAL